MYLGPPALRESPEHLRLNRMRGFSIPLHALTCSVRCAGAMGVRRRNIDPYPSVGSTSVWRILLPCILTRIAGPAAAPGPSESFLSTPSAGEQEPHSFHQDIQTGSQGPSAVALASSPPTQRCHRTGRCRSRSLQVPGSSQCEIKAQLEGR